MQLSGHIKDWLSTDTGHGRFYAPFGNQLRLMAVYATILDAIYDGQLYFLIACPFAQHLFQIKDTVIIQAGFQHAGGRDTHLVAC